MSIIDGNRIPVMMAALNTDGTTLTNVQANPSSRNSLQINNAFNLLNEDFSSQPSFTAVTSTFNRWIDGTAGGSTTDSTYGWGFQNTSSGSGSAKFDNVGGTDCITLVATGLVKSGVSSGQNFVSNVRDYPGATIASYNTSYMLKVVAGNTYTISGDYWIHSASDTTNVVTMAHLTWYKADGITRISSTTTANKYGTTLNTWLPITGGSIVAPALAEYAVLTVKVSVAGVDGVDRAMTVSYSNLNITETTTVSTDENTLRNQNYKTGLWALSAVDGVTPVQLYCDSSGKLLINSN